MSLYPRILQRFLNGILTAYADGTVGSDVNPRFRQQPRVAGIGRAEMAIDFLNDAASGVWRKVLGLEATGTLAAVRDGLQGSHIEGFRRDGAFKPLFRFNSYPRMGIELAAIGGQANAGGVVRSGTTVTATLVDSAGTAIEHGFLIGMTLKVISTDPLFSQADVVVTGVSSNQITYTQSGTAGASTTLIDYSSEPDTRIERGPDRTWRFYVNSVLVAVMYQDAVVMQAGAFFVGSSQDGLTAAGTNQATSLQLTSQRNFLSTVASGTGVAMPFTGGGGGRDCLVYNGGASTLTIYPLIGSSDQVNGGSSLSLTAGAQKIFYGYNGGWRSI